MNLSEKEKDIFGTKNFGKSGSIPSSQFAGNDDDDEPRIQKEEGEASP
jgi:hypothetical protein